MAAKEILEKYNALRNSYYESDCDPIQEAKDYVNAVLDSNKNAYHNPWMIELPVYRYLKSKYKNRVRDNCIGFSLSLPCPTIWYNIVDEFLIYVSKQCPAFEILQICIKNGGIKITLDNISDEINEEIAIIEEALYDYKLLK